MPFSEKLSTKRFEGHDPTTNRSSNVMPASTSQFPRVLTGWHYATRDPIEITCAGGTITSIRHAPTDPPNQWLAPALVDVQVNGYGGVDFQNDAINRNDLELAAHQLRRDGCSRFLLTLVTDTWPRLTRRLQRLRAIRSESSLLSSAIAGWHIEGPFLSPEPGFHGAHDPSVMCDPTADHIRELRQLTGEDPVLLTVAAERAGAVDAIKAAVACGIRVSLGHTNASAVDLREALSAGASGFTHLGNACPQQLDRHDNILWRVLDSPGLMLGLIVDGLHVSPPFFRLVHRAAPVTSIYYTTDAMSAAGAPPGRYRIGHLELEVGDDGIVRQPGKTNFAGSALRPIEGVIRAARMRGCSWREVWDHFSVYPARWMGLAAGLKTGAPAHIAVVKPSEADHAAGPGNSSDPKFRELPRFECDILSP